MKKYVWVLVVVLMAATLSVSAKRGAKGAKGDGSLTIDFAKAKGSSLQNVKQPDGSMFWIDNSWASFDRSVYKGVAPSVQWIYGECPIPPNKWWQGFGANDVKWDLSGFTHITITYMANRAGDAITFTLSEAHPAQAREASVTFTPEVANEWVELKLALTDLVVPEGLNYLNKQYAPPTWSNITGWLVGAGTVKENDGFLWIDSIAFTKEAVVAVVE